MTRVFGMYRMANSMALLDAKIRGVGPDQAVGGARLRQLLVAHRSAARPSDGHRAADRRVRSARRRAGEDRRRVGHELDHHQDARLALADRGAPQGHEDRRHRLRVLGHLHQGRRGDRRPAGHDAGAGARARRRDHAREAVRRRLREALDRSAGARAHGHAQVPAGRRRLRRRAGEARQSDARARGRREGAAAGRAARHAHPREAARRVGRLRLVGPGRERAAGRSPATRWVRIRWSAIRCSKAASR